MTLSDKQKSDLTIDTHPLDAFLADFEGTLPKHVAIIMDGNGRWAKQRGKERLFGHKAGADAVSRIVESSRYLNIEVLTLYAFSSQNWGRPQSEVSGLMEIFVNYMIKEKNRLINNDIRLRVIGDRDPLPTRVRERMESLEEETASLDGMTLQVAISYGGREEILKGVRDIARAVASGDIAPNDITAPTFEKFLYTHDLPDPDLVIRTSGEERISNFLLWQIAYSEILFTPVLWPDFGEKNFVDALKEFSRRERRFGKVS